LVSGPLLGQESGSEPRRWATIALITVLIRVCLLRVVVSGLQHNVRWTAVTSQVTRLTERISEAQKAKDQQALAVHSQTLQNLFKEHNVHPLRPFLGPLASMPIFFSMIYALRWMGTAPLPSLKDGGFGWFTDMTLPDPYYILPLTSMVFSNIVLRVCPLQHPLLTDSY